MVYIIAGKEPAPHGDLTHGFFPVMYKIITEMRNPHLIVP
jgi:hypothetical protein